VDLESKRVELLKEAIPDVSRAVVLTNPANPLSRASLDAARQAAEKLAVKIEGEECSRRRERSCANKGVAPRCCGNRS
jgi:hypothetical protein